MAEVAALYTGTFDPLTHGHADVIRQAARLCGRLIVAIGVHPGKKPIFEAQERADMIRACGAPLVAGTGCSLEVVTFDGLAVEAALEPRVVGGFDEGVGLGILEPAVAGFAVEPTSEFVRRVVVGHCEALPRGVEDGGG